VRLRDIPADIYEYARLLGRDSVSALTESELGRFQKAKERDDKLQWRATQEYLRDRHELVYGKSLASRLGIPAHVTEAASDVWNHPAMAAATMLGGPMMLGVLTASGTHNPWLWMFAWGVTGLGVKQFSDAVE
jgi:hypothetical protein